MVQRIRYPDDRSRVFPGLWLDPDALLARNTRRLREVLDLARTTPEHATFIARLATARETPVTGTADG
jgi:hypothetical protein